MLGMTNELLLQLSVCHSYGNAGFVILNEVKNLYTKKSKTIEIPRVARNDKQS